MYLMLGSYVVLFSRYASNDYIIEYLREAAYRVAKLCANLSMLVQLVDNLG